MRLGFFLREALRAMRRNAAPSFAALATVLVTMLVVGVFIPAVEVTNAAANNVRGRLIVDVYMKTSSTKTDDARVGREIKALAHVQSGGSAFAALLTIASILRIANTIRLSLFARRREVEVMRLVGATNWFIRWPFVIEGVLVGAVGAVLAIVVLAIVKIALLDPLFSGWALVGGIR